MQPILVLWTCESAQEARRVAKILLEKRLVACASFSPVESLFHWEGKVEHAQEYKIFFKTHARHFQALSQEILRHASYEVPEILRLDLTDGNPHYLNWLETELS